MMKRREVLGGMATAAGSSLLSCAGGATARSEADPAEASPAREEQLGADDGDALDQALTRLHATDPEFDGGLSNLGPMAAEALEAMGAFGRIPEFVRGYATRLRPMPPAEPLPGDQWRRALGRLDARAALIETFDRRLRDQAPDEVLADVLPVLASGVAAAAFHGVLRVGHARRAWGRRASDVRRTELAHGLGYWASRHQPLPGEPGRRAVAGLGPLAALHDVPLVDPSERHQGGLILERFEVLSGRPGFVRAVEAFDPDARSPDEALDELVLASARLYLSTSSGRARFVYLHGVTGTAALRELLPALPEPTQRALVGYHFAAIAAVHATHGNDDGGLDRQWSAPDVEPETIARSAAASDDDHTIKLVEAALREHRRRGHPELLAVARHRVGIEG